MLWIAVNSAAGDRIDSADRLNAFLSFFFCRFAVHSKFAASYLGPLNLVWGPFLVHQNRIEEHFRHFGVPSAFDAGFPPMESIEKCLLMDVCSQLILLRLTYRRVCFIERFNHLFIRLFFLSGRLLSVLFRKRFVFRFIFHVVNELCTKMNHLLNYTISTLIYIRRWICKRMVCARV